MYVAPRTAEVESILRSSIKNGYGVAFINTLLVYDYALTSGQEVELFWRRGPPVSRVLMFCCRLLVLMYVPTTMLATYFLPLYTTMEGCKATYLVYLPGWFISIFVSAVVTAIRAYAVTMRWRQWTLSAAVIFFGLVDLGMTIYLSVKTSYELVQLDGSAPTCWHIIERDMPEALFTIENTSSQSPPVVSLACMDPTQRCAILFINLTVWFANITGNRLEDLNVPIQLLLISRLLIDLRQASEQDIHASSLTSSILNSQLSDAIAVTASSTLRFQRPGSSREWQSTGA
ncbi:hypothetical protein C8Q72DRAFT_796525 [Fomitopsis betulina]|nr:hypothetical protein C8Q72DRAFT_796525 [Fomitopsis betulina]